MFKPFHFRIFLTVAFLATLHLFMPKVRAANLFSTDLTYNTERERGYILGPLGSLLLPGFDQWVEGQFSSALIYSSVALGGLSLASEAGNESTNISDIEEASDRQRQTLYGLQLYQTMGSLSAFHSFRTAVKSRTQTNDFKFLTKDEDTGDLLKAPFEFEHILKPTSYIPLGLLAAFIAAGWNEEPRHFRGKDAAFSLGVSYNAGVGEEALFRGYMMPALMNSLENEFWSNAITSVTFAALHISSDNPYPLSQLALGYYFGWLTQKNNWTLAESIFIHTWWDVLVFVSVTATQGESASAGIFIPLVHYGF